MLAVFVIIILALIVVCAVLDVTARRRGSRVRSPGDIKLEVREQRRQLRARQSSGFRRTGDEDDEASFSPDREERLGR